MNLVCISGRLTSDPILKSTNSGKNYTKFTLAVKKIISQQNKENNTDFIPCIVWGNQAELIARTVKKGNRLIVNGNINVDTYEKDGTKHTSFNISVNNFEYVELKKDTEIKEEQ